MKRNPHHTRRPADQPALFETGSTDPPGAYPGRVILLPDGTARYTVPAPARTGRDPLPANGLAVQWIAADEERQRKRIAADRAAYAARMQQPRTGPDPRAADLARARDEEGAGT